jgi:glycosyltransferase involved in cell wall biosynthesis
VGEDSPGNGCRLPSGVESDLSRHASDANGGTWTNVHLVSSRKTLVAIPAWNEEGSIAEVIGLIQLHEPDADILVVNDGSTDSTALVATNAGAIVVSLPFNVGVGGAMRTAFLFAQRGDYQCVVQVDADGQHEPAELNALIAGLDEFDIVVGTRFHPNSTYHVRGPRRWAMKLLSRTLSRMAKTPISDPTSGFRSAGPRAIQLFSGNYPAEYLGDTVGSLAIAIRTGLKIEEVPVTMYFREYGRPSKNALWSTLYLGRASLALVVQLLRRTRKSDETH